MKYIDANETLKAIVKYIEGLSGCDLVLGENLFAGHLPTKDTTGDSPPIRCVVVLETGGSSLVPDLPDVEEKGIQVWNRAENYFDAREDAYCIYLSLHSYCGISIDFGGEEYEAMVIEAVQTPYPIENPNEQGHYVFSTNYTFSLESPPSPDWGRA